MTQFVFLVKPGDLFEWYYVVDDRIVVDTERIWSTTMELWVPIGGLHLLLGISEDILTWLMIGRPCRSFKHVRAVARGPIFTAALGTTGPLALRRVGGK